VFSISVLAIENRLRRISKPSVSAAASRNAARASAPIAGTLTYAARAATMQS
jgi:hypothetical protein